MFEKFYGFTNTPFSRAIPTDALYNLCTHALLYGAQQGHRIIDDHRIKRVVEGELA